MDILKNLDICLEINQKIVCQFNSKITQENIVKCAKDIKENLILNNINSETIYEVYDVTIEILQNILKYSYANVTNEDNQREADGKFSIVYNTEKSFVIKSSCLVTKKQMETIQKRVVEVQFLSKDKLKELRKEKMRLRKDGHKNGAGLGFVTIALRVTKPLKVNFFAAKDGIYIYLIEVTI